MSELTFSSTSAGETQALGERLGTLLEPGDVLVLTGDLGAGKTQLTKGIARSLGVADEVTSPTFALEAVHEGAEMPLYHFDLYRLQSVIEWGEQFVDEIGDERLDVYVTRLETQAVAGEEPPREVRLVAHDARGEQILAGLAS